MNENTFIIRGKSIDMPWRGCSGGCKLTGRCSRHGSIPMAGEEKNFHFDNQALLASRISCARIQHLFKFVKLRSPACDPLPVDPSMPAGKRAEEPAQLQAAWQWSPGARIALLASCILVTGALGWLCSFQIPSHLNFKGLSTWLVLALVGAKCLHLWHAGHVTGWTLQRYTESLARISIDGRLARKLQW